MNVTFREAKLPFGIPSLISAIPELQPCRQEEIDARLNEADPLLLLAESNGTPAGFKLGYRLTPEIFYSWIGGVCPEHRRSGLATTLLKLQEQVTRDRGYRLIRVKSMNRFPAMLQFLISQGYQIVGTEGSAHESDRIKIVFEKSLQ
jgi:GNAT superfamily N-acetyltransferase